MADIKKRVPENIEGNFFVDSTCIDCGTCRQIAPGIFSETDSYSYVYHQPQGEEATCSAIYALLSCPTGSIGTQASNRAKEHLTDFPLLIEDEVYYCGFTSPKSYGASSYFIRHPEGNWLIDSPKYLPVLVEQFRQLGGIRYLFLSHRDDVADADQYAKTFGAQRIIHQEELSAQPDAEMVIEGFEPQVIQPGFVVIPTPGHTRGHCALLYRNYFLFSGDHIWWESSHQRLEMPTYYLWNQAEQRKSSQRLQHYQFEWILPGHGNRIHLNSAAMRRAFDDLLARNPV